MTRLTPISQKPVAATVAVDRDANGLVKCLNPGCDMRATCRGLCASCYRVAVKIVRCGVRTWKQLEAEGKCNPANRKLYGKTQRWLLSSKSETNQIAKKEHVV